MAGEARKTRSFFSDVLGFFANWAKSIGGGTWQGAKTSLLIGAVLGTLVALASAGALAAAPLLAAGIAAAVGGAIIGVTTGTLTTVGTLGNVPAGLGVGIVSGGLTSMGIYGGLSGVVAAATLAGTAPVAVIAAGVIGTALLGTALFGGTIGAYGTALGFAWGAISGPFKAFSKLGHEKANALEQESQALDHQIAQQESLINTQIAQNKQKLDALTQGSPATDERYEEAPTESIEGANVERYRSGGQKRIGDVEKKDITSQGLLNAPRKGMELGAAGAGGN